MRLIDAEVLLKQLEDWRGDKEDLDMEDGHDVAYYSAMSRAMRFTKCSPTIDVATVVRCKDCRYRFTNNCPMFFEEQTYNEDDGYDWVDHDHTSDDGFCNEGARMDGEENAAD